MKLIAILTCVVTATVAIKITLVLEKYSDQYDDSLNATEVLNNDDLRQEYYSCFTGTGPCKTPVAVYYNGNFPEAVATNCLKCTEKQKEMLKITEEWYLKNQPNQWQSLIQILLIRYRKKPPS